MVVAQNIAADATVESLSAIFAQFGEVVAVLRRKTPASVPRRAEIVFATAEQADAACAAGKLTRDGTIVAGDAEAEADTDAELITLTSASTFVTPAAAEKTREKRDRDGDARDAPKRERTYVSGVILKLSGLTGGIDRDQIRDIFMEHGEVRFVNYRPQDGDTDAEIRFVEEDPTVAKQICDKMSADEAARPALGDAGKDYTLRVLEGEEEKSYWEAIWARADTRAAGSKFKRGGRGSYGKGRGGKRNNRRD
eukprot:gnl/Ergobibamus_cyprinoides/68.p1 GENE.gnl/Ergobibamus_cyprinoides/68~~gnl/Ergobibamus_cyprinoides/68.p1  ORF type:complete len:252 (+),score=112.33 gnl/Ergobibamus_cyprinoides/68:297-1052(+)